MVTPEVEHVNSLVRRYLDVYEVRITPDHLEFYFTLSDKGEFEKNFESLRLEMKKINAIPMVRKRGGEYVLIVVKSPPRKYFSVWVNVVLLIATILSTIWVGMGYYVAYYGSVDLTHDLLGGLLYFSLPLLTILGCHEMGHYLAAKRHNIAASLPFFIPAPTMLGTLGAFISIREPIPDKKALIDVGLSGPIVGFIVAIPVTIIGLILGSQNPPHVDMESVNTYLIFNVPLIYDLLEKIFPSSNFVHPVAMAGWVGFIVTAINLFPIGQLDGGHAIRAVLGENAKYVSYGFAALLIVLGIFYPGWLFFGLIVIFLGLRHPPPLNDIVKLDGKRVAVAMAALLIFAVTFVPVPVEVVNIHEDVEVNAHFGNDITLIGINSTIPTLYINISNRGEMPENITLMINASLGKNTTVNRSFVFSLKQNSWRNLAEDIKPVESGNHTVYLFIKTKTGIRKWLNLTFTALSISDTMAFIPSEVSRGEFNATLVNHGMNRTVHIVSINGVDFNITNLNRSVIDIRENESITMHFLVIGSTYILAVDYSTYEAAVISVKLG